MSLQLVLQNYLASLRERDELDALLPELLIAMGHSVVSRPQVGVAQAGVDIASLYPGSDGSEEVFLFILKFGDVGRADLFTGQQAIQPSIREAYTDFARNRLSEAQRALRKRVVVVSNGVLKQEAAAAFAGMVDEVAERPSFSLEFWGIDQLTPLIEKFVFDESLLLAHGKSDLRAALAGLEDSAAAIRRFARFVETCFQTPDNDAQQSEEVRRKKFLRRCAAAAMGHAVLVVWGKAEGNLKPGVVCGEYLALRLWAKAVELGFSENEQFQHRINATLVVHLSALFEYFGRILPSLSSRRRVAWYRPNAVFYAQLVFEEVGRLATLLLLLQHDGADQELRQVVCAQLVTLLNTHTILSMPPMDTQGIDLSLVFAALIGEGEIQSARNLLRGLIARFQQAVRRNDGLPVDSDLIEDAVAVHITKTAGSRDFFRTSTLAPMLASVAASLQDEEALASLRMLQSQLIGVTLERWFPAEGFERFTGAKQSLADVGISRVLQGFRETAALEVQASMELPDGASPMEAFRWVDTNWEVLVALSARLHRHPLPTWYLQASVERAVQLSASRDETGAQAPAASEED